jgi:hypothetical protein
MIYFYPGEEWRELVYENKYKVNYAISSYGRLVSYTDSIKTGRLLKPGEVKGFKVFKRFSTINGKRKVESFFVHKKVAEFFLPPKREDQTFVIHLNFVKDDNRSLNLKWASKKEMEAHQSLNPKVIECREKLHHFNRTSPKGYKLTEEKVRVIKRKLLDPNRKTKIRILARQFGVTEMQLYRIKKGENWGHVHVDIPPKNPTVE